MPKPPKLIALPIDRLLSEVRETLTKGSSLVLQATPGSGKTTRVPPALLSDCQGEILVLEPRRLAAKLAAQRVAFEMGERPGETVGYQFRFENVGGRATRLRFLTEGMLMRRLLGDPMLVGVSVVILDEFHERHLHGDIALAALRALQRGPRPELRLLVMSATLDCGPIAEFLGGAPVIRAELPRFEIATYFLPQPPTRSLERLVRDAVGRALDDGDGDILVFLPGMADIRRSQAALDEEFGRKLLITPLHGELTREEQDLAIVPARDGRRKVILSTNVAETSLTIEGVSSVIDSGLQRTASYSWWTGVPALRTRPTSRASAAQRAGRAGRTGPGRCYRLYSKGEFDGRPAFDVPEILRADLAQTFLELKELGVADLAAFPWFESPPPGSIQATSELLHLLGALDEPTPAATLTPLGREMARIPAHPRLARVLIEAVRNGATQDAATLCALVYEGGLEEIDALAQVERGRFGETIGRTRTQLLSALPRGRGEDARRRADKKNDVTESRGDDKPAGKSRKELAGALERAVLTGFPDRVAQKRGERELVLAAGGTAGVAAEATVISGSEMFIVLDAQERQGAGQLKSRLEAKSVIAISPDWLLDLEPSLLRERDELTWDEARGGRIQRASRLTYGQLVLSESLGPADLTKPEDQEAAAKLLLKSLFGLTAEMLATLDMRTLAQRIGQRGLVGEDAIEGAIARAALLVASVGGMPGGKSGAGAAVPSEHAFTGEQISAALRMALAGKLSLEETKEIDWPTALVAALAPEQAHLAERLVPTQIALPSGRRARVNYKLGQAPWVESRLQDFFGMKQGPAILYGKIPLALHLLAPNQRALQITTDLSGFWERHYPQIRKELSRRYPRHKWPEDPLQ